ncbi:DUF202 domain-containing protein [Micromonospora sp. KC721]|uniref:DUF202 domain-containing protein n=1 Tax=Micromonospora sp. KC721 TaxID=2530380 RepID=UPI00104CB9C4|nr:DUF202 domain-containing protein [Micromonospora sp. KC721]TDB69486.1 DUF202 domain-containing protein [Micromonospora sp. KC721]
MTRDPGRQPERTRLAWRRTGLTMTVVAGLALRLALTGGVTGAVLAVAVVLLWAGALVALWGRAAGRGPLGVDTRSLPSVALATAGVALLSVPLVLRGVW